MGSQIQSSLILNAQEIDEERKSQVSQSSRNSISNSLSNRATKCKCKQRILIVDDNCFNLMPIKLLLKDMKLDFSLIERIKNGTSQSIVSK